jgi:hypothetical protein
MLISKFREKFKLVWPACQRPTTSLDRVSWSVHMHTRGHAMVAQSSHTTERGAAGHCPPPAAPCVRRPTMSPYPLLRREHNANSTYLPHHRTPPVAMQHLPLDVIEESPCQDTLGLRPRAPKALLREGVSLEPPATARPK